MPASFRPPHDDFTHGPLEGNVKNALQGDAHVRDLTQVVLHGVFVDLQSGRRPDARLTDALRETCDAARDQGLHAEELLVIVKQSWHHLADAQFIDRRDADATLSQLVTTCIREYYRPDSPADRASRF